jgi:hypothetical protein
MIEGNLPPATCPKCGNVHDGWTNLDEDSEESPEPGAIIVCGDCGNINEIQEDSSFAEPQEGWEERLSVAELDAVKAAQKFVQQFNEHSQ